MTFHPFILIKSINIDNIFIQDNLTAMKSDGGKS
jgi:hypothetical protein